MWIETTYLWTTNHLQWSITHSCLGPPTMFSTEWKECERSGHVTSISLFLYTAKAKLKANTYNVCIWLQYPWKAEFVRPEDQHSQLLMFFPVLVRLPYYIPLFAIPLWLEHTSIHMLGWEEDWQMGGLRGDSEFLLCFFTLKFLGWESGKLEKSERDVWPSSTTNSSPITLLWTQTAEERRKGGRHHYLCQMGGTETDTVVPQLWKLLMTEQLAV